MAQGNLQVWLVWWSPCHPVSGGVGGGEEPLPVALAREVVDGPAALFAAGVVTRRCAAGSPRLLATNALVGEREGVLVYALHSPWAAFVPRLRLRGGEIAPSALAGPLRGAQGLC